MTTPTPSPALMRAIDDYRAELFDLLAALQQPQRRAVQAAVVHAISGLFERVVSLLGHPTPISDTNGADPDVVAGQLFVEPSEAELATMPRKLNGFDAQMD